MIRSRRESADLDPNEGLRLAGELCRDYWRPVYSYLRAAGYDREDAEDLTQGFFVSAIQSDLFEKADPDKGRLRNYLIGALKHFVGSERRKANAMKRGGGVQIIPLDTLSEEHSRGFLIEPASDEISPDQAFDRRWAECLLETSLSGLRQEYEAAGKVRQFEALRPFLDGGGEMATADSILGVGEGALRVLVHRFRKRFRERIKAEIRQTLSFEADLAEELNRLLASMARQKKM